MNVYQYSRISTSMQSLAQQQLRVSEFLASKGLELTATIEEEGVSGYNKSYKERRLTELLDMMSEGDCLIVSELSRLCRRMSDMSKLINDDLKPRKLRLIIISMGIDLQCDKMRAVDELIINNFAFAAQVEAEMLHDRINAGHRAKKAQIERDGQFVNRRGELCIGNYADQYGKRTNGTHQRSCTIAGKVSAEKRKQKALNNEHNIKFVDALQLYEEANGRIGANTDITPFVRMLNKLKLKTSTGLEFNNARAKAMLTSMRNIFDLYAV